MTIVSDPLGAAVTVNGRQLGAAPVDVPSLQFLYYGTYEFLLIKDGYEPLLVKQDVPPPWYGRWPFDFFAENLIPWDLKDKRVFAYQLMPTRVVPTAELLDNANSYRTRGQGIGPPLESPAALPLPSPVGPGGAPEAPSPAPVRLEAPVPGG